MSHRWWLAGLVGISAAPILLYRPGFFLFCVFAAVALFPIIIAPSRANHFAIWRGQFYVLVGIICAWGAFDAFQIVRSMLGA